MASEVSEVASMRADRPSDGDSDAHKHPRTGVALAFCLILVASGIAVYFGVTSGIRTDQIVEKAAEFGSLASDKPVDPGPPPTFMDVAFPDLSRHGWTPAGARRDIVADRVALTVFYTGAGEGSRLAVTILFGQALPPPPGSRVVRGEGVAIARMVRGDRTIVSWRRRGRTTIMSAVSTEPADLVRLARIATPRPPARSRP